MKFAVLLAVLMICPVVMAATCPKQSRTKDELLEVEQSWAVALEKSDTDTIECILASEFQDADINGALHDRSEALEKAQRPRQTHNELSDLEPHLYGDLAYVRGLNTVTDAQGKPVAKVRFTDIFIFRHGRWQAVAGQETLLKDAISAGK